MSLTCSIGRIGTIQTVKSAGQAMEFRSICRSSSICGASVTQLLSSSMSQTSFSTPTYSGDS